MSKSERRILMAQEQRILIVEDDEMQRRELVRNLQDLHPSLVIQSARNLAEAQSILQKSILDNAFLHLFLLDIHLSSNEKKHEGFQFAQLIRSHTVYQMTPLIFLTSNKRQIEFALNNFHCYNYIKKPYNCGEIAKQVQHLLLSHMIRQETFFIRDTRRIAHRVAKETILFLESNGHTLKIVCTHNTIITRDYNLTSIVEHLGDGFFRCHRKYIVNAKLIENYDSLCSNVQIRNHTIPVGRVYKDKLLESIQLT